MADASYVQSSFIGGELSKLAQGRYHDPRYRAAMAVCLNGIPIESDAWVRRPGFGNAGTTRNGRPGRLIEFDHVASAPSIMEFTDGKQRFRNGIDLLTTNDEVRATTIAAGGEITLASAVTWATGDQGYFSGLGSNAPLLQNRVFSLTFASTTLVSVTDPITGEAMTGTAVGSLGPDAVLHRVQERTTPYTGGAWSGLRSIQTENTAFLLLGSVQPYAVTITTAPADGVDAQFAIAAAVFNDGPYLDPFTNGVQANPSAKLGSITLSLSFPAYDAAKAYKAGDYVSSSSVNYVSLLDQNINHTPASSATYWQAVSALTAVTPGGADQGDFGRLVRLFSEPDLWAVGTAYAVGTVVAYNPSGLPGQTTYWSSLTSHTGKIPGSDLINWTLMAQGGTSSPAIWSWGKIVGLANQISGTLLGSVNIGTMTANGGLVAAFDGVLAKVHTACAALAQTNITFSAYVGKDYSGAAAQAIGSATYYPSTNFGLGAQIGGLGVNTPPSSITINLRAKATAPASASDGTLLGTSGAIANTTSPVSITSNDTTTTWNYVWFEVIVTFPSSVAGNTVFCAQAIFFNPAGTGTGAALTVEILGPSLLYTTPIRTWRIGVFSNKTGWPSCGTYSDGRMWLSGAVPNRVDACVSDGIKNGTVDFAPTDQYGNVNAASAISYVFNAPDANPIYWMVPDLQGIIAGTKAGEWLITAPTAGGITVFNISARRVTKNGCANIEPRRTENTTVFVQKHRRKIMEYFADVMSGKFSAPSITWLSKHLTEGGIDEIEYQQELCPTVWARVAGALVGWTYKRDTLATADGPTLFGGHRHTLGSGRTVESICVGPSTGGNVDALSIVSNDPATDIRHVEVLTDILDEDSALSEASYLDNAVTPSSTTPSAAGPYGGLTLNGLSHLEGKTVAAWLGGLDCGDYTVADGSISVPYGDGISAGTATGLFTEQFVNSFDGEMPMRVGFTYNSDGQIVRPHMPAESGARNGPAFGKERRSHWTIAQLVGTQGISFGTSFDDMNPANFLDAAGTPYRLNEQFTGIFKDQFKDDYSLDSMLCWRISRPYIANIAAIGAALQTQDM